MDHALNWIEQHIDQQLIHEAEAAGISGAYTAIGSMSLKDKLDAYISEGVDQLEEEHGARYIWREIYDLVELRPKLDLSYRESYLQAWLDAHGWDDPTLELPQAPPALKVELVLRIALDGLMIYLAGWFEIS